MILVWAPLLVLAWITRQEMAGRLTEEHTRRVDDQAAVLQEDLEGWNRHLGARLENLRAQIENNNRFRLGAVEGISEDPSYVLDYAGSIMNLLGLSVLEIRGQDGHILSSGQFRNEYGRGDPLLPKLLAREPGAALARFREPKGGILALARIDSLNLAARTFYLIGGIRADREFLSRLTRDANFAVSLIGPGFVVSTSDTLEALLARGIDDPDRDWQAVFPSEQVLTRTESLPMVLPDAARGARIQPATLVGSYSLRQLRDILHSLDLWLLAALAATVVGSLILSLWVSSRISRPLVQLAETTTQVDLDRLDADFRSDRADEIGDLSRFLAAMMARLRASSRKLRDAERRATLGELARQVNHDVRNGLIPIRNVIRHLGQVARDEPERLTPVWNERWDALNSGVGYLEALAENYARLYRQNPRRRCNLNAMVREEAAGRTGEPGLEMVLRLTEDLPPVLADPVALRRIIDNLVTNAQEAFENGRGRIELETGWNPGDDAVTLAVVDNGPGIPEDRLGRVFNDFFTTKERGSGLGLSIVRRMVADCEGSIQVRSRPGEGTRFILRFAAADGAAGTEP